MMGGCDSCIQLFSINSWISIFTSFMVLITSWFFFETLKEGKMDETTDPPNQATVAMRDTGVDKDKEASRGQVSYFCSLADSPQPCLSADFVPL